MPSRKPSSTSRSGEQRKPRYFVDRNLGSFVLPNQLRAAGLNIIVHDDVYVPTERDPWLFYEAGKKGHVVITADVKFKKSFPHMAAISLAKTQVVGFANNKGTSEQKGNAFILARAAVEAAIAKHKGRSFIGVVGKTGSFRICDESPLPSRVTCDPRDWDSFERVCKEAGLLPLAPKH